MSETEPISATDIETLLNGSDVIGIQLSKEKRAWRCKVHGLRAAGGATAPTLLQAVYDAVVKHNEEWSKLIDG